MRIARVSLHFHTLWHQICYFNLVYTDKFHVVTDALLTCLCLPENVNALFLINALVCGLIKAMDGLSLGETRVVDDGVEVYLAWGVGAPIRRVTVYVLKRH